MPILTFLLGNWRVVLLAVLVAALTVQTKRLDHAQAETAQVTAAFAVFKQQITAQAEQQRKDNERKAKEIDDANRAKLRDLDAAYAGYRQRVRDGAGATASLVPAASGPGDDTRVCYTRDTLDREIRAAVASLRSGLADESEPYDRAAVVAKQCRDWALGLR
jgi:hypothetical protein